MSDVSYNKFNIGRLHGTPKWAEFSTIYGPIKIYRREGWSIEMKAGELQLIVPGLPVKDPNEILIVPVQDYDDHFIMEMPKKVDGKPLYGPSYMCSCGLPVGFYGSESYKHGASPVGIKVHCVNVMEYGKHADGVIK